nr:hypothetical protein [Tanacetum cinerariifolium]
MFPSQLDISKELTSFTKILTSKFLSCCTTSTPLDSLPTTPLEPSGFSLIKLLTTPPPLIPPTTPTQPSKQSSPLTIKLEPIEHICSTPPTYTHPLVFGVEDCRCLLVLWEWGERGVKEKNKDVAAKDGVSPSVTVEPVVKEKQSSLVDTSIPDVENTDFRSYSPLPTQGSTPTGNALGKSSYANITRKPSGKKVNVRTLFTPGERRWHALLLLTISINGLYVMLENGPWFIRNNPLILKKWHPDENLLKEDVSTVPVWVKLHGVPVTAFSENGLSAIATKLGTPLVLDSYTSDMCMQSWGRSSYAIVMIELRADVELKDNIVVAMPKITREGHYTCNVHVESEWKPFRCSSCKVFGHIHEECSKNTGAGEKKTVKKPSQTSQGVPVGPKLGFKPQKEYRRVPKKPNASSSGNKKKTVEPTIEVSNSNPFDVLNSTDNDVEFGKLRLLDNDGNPLVPTGIVESDSEVEVVFDETANLRISMSGKDGSDKGYGTNSLLEQWMDSYLDNDDYDLYDNDMYKNNDLSEHLQSICDDLDITVRGRKKK